MTEVEARAYALDLLRRRREKGWSRESIEATSYEGASGQGLPGYLMSAGRITVPCAFQHNAPGCHTFRLSALLDAIESPQGGLFA